MYVYSEKGFRIASSYWNQNFEAADACCPIPVVQSVLVSQAQKQCCTVCNCFLNATSNPEFSFSVSLSKLSLERSSCPSLLQYYFQTPKMLTRKIKLWDINAHITCRLCNGYLIDATTVTECLHTFCRSCLVKYLEENNTCPTCRIVIHQSHPLQYIGHDRTMQDIVYKLVPGLQDAEMRKQREFYHKLGMEVPGDIKGETCSAKQHLDSHRNGETKADESSNKETSEEKQEEDNDYHRSDEQVSICLECNSSKLRGLKRKWIRCSAQATVLHLKKFIAKKLNLSSFNELDILCNEEILGKDHTLKFVVVTRWRFKVRHNCFFINSLIFRMKIKSLTWL
ncbi:Polycomb group RING finger protein 3 [Chelonia mydas]|uniref:Polycomb group RING finger protein 3 n=1 Tax=Chelonia mydas TaxID=8469 RepID=M7BS07_CHEMY|nr:Polycomb group RING finger protein 3 [Chelonia mydas]